MKRILNKQERDFLEKNISGKSTIEITKLLNEKFNRNLTQKQISKYKKNHKIKSGIGNLFQKGEKHFAYKPVGSERINRCYNQKEILIKNESGIWERKEVYLYKKHIGKIPKGYTILFLDGDIENFDLKNLALISKKAKCMMNLRNMRTKNVEINKTNSLVAELTILTNEKKRSDLKWML